MDETAKKLEIAVEALKAIMVEGGMVCPEFELCDHAVCQSSYAAWAIADEALRKLGMSKRGGSEVTPCPLAPR